MRSFVNMVQSIGMGHHFGDHLSSPENIRFEAFNDVKFELLFDELLHGGAIILIPRTILVTNSLLLLEVNCQGLKLYLLG